MKNKNMLTTEEIHKKWLVWDFISQCWCEITPTKEEYPITAKELAEVYDNWQDIEAEITQLRLSFAPEMVSMYVFMPLIPDWGYNKEFLEQRIQKWYQLNKIKIWLNPLRIVGLPVIYLITFIGVRRLKREFLKVKP